MTIAAVNEQEFMNYKMSVARRSFLEKTEEGVGYGLLTVFSTIFGFFTTPQGRELLTEHNVIPHSSLHTPPQIFLFPIAALIELADLTVAGIRLAVADNKNLDKTLNFASKLARVGIIVPAVGIGTAGAILGSAALSAVVPYMFVTALAIAAVYNIGKTLYHLKKMLDAPQGSALRAAHKQAFIGGVVGSALSMVLVGVVAALFVVGVTSPVGLGVAAGVGLVAIAATVVVNLVMKYRAKNAAATTNKTKVEDKVSLMQEKAHAIEAVINGDDSVAEATKAEGAADDRLYVRDLSSLLNVAKSKGDNELKETFEKIIEAEIKVLQGQIDEVQTKATPSKFTFFTDETPKRKSK
ncbi:MAG: hypothetical protein KDH94_04500, partial [Coxiellaceae bacterium]|nr:hypothetical protein [Coxiellaceae bacterium]